MRTSHSLLKRSAFASGFVLAATRVAFAQTEPPLPPLPSESTPPTEPAPVDPAPAPQVRVVDPNSPPSSATPANSATTPPPSSPNYDPYSGAKPYDPATPQYDPELAKPSASAGDDEEKRYKAWSRKQSVFDTTTIAGGIGLFHTVSASGGEAGQFRFSLLGGIFSGGGFLCSSSAPCADPVTGELTGADSSQRINAHANISATPFSFLEAYLVLKNTATQNNRGRPQLLQILGDTVLGVKAFTPVAADRIFYFGGVAELLMMTGTGGVGLNGSATGFTLKGLATLDLNNRLKEEDRFPLRAHANLGYVFDNSAAIVSSLEKTPPPAGRGSPIARTERYGLNISRVDSFQIALGAEYVNDWVRPFLEWSVDIPVNRQGYVCNENSAAARGDWCLGKKADLVTTPSRLSLGARGYPWQDSGLALTLGFDIGTSGTKSFLEETKPETPWTMWFGLAYGVDTVPPEPKVVEIPSKEPPAPAREIRRYAIGQVVDVGNGGAIPDALVRFEADGFTGMIADKNGYFLTTDLAPGEYKFQVFAAEYKPGSCSVTIPEKIERQPATGRTFRAELDGSGVTTTPPSEAPKTPAGSAPEINEDGDYEVPVRCELKELPKVANVVGLVVDAQSGAPVPDATVTITDKLGRSLTLAGDAQGSLLFKNVVFGQAALVVNAPGYLPASSVVTIDSRKDVTAHISVTARPTKSNITAGARQLKLAKSIEFIGETKEVTAESMAIVEELAAYLNDNAKVQKVEIAVHSDDSGAASYSRRLTQDRADAIRDTLTRLGVDSSRVSAKGYGPDEPLTANVSDAARAKNRRVEIRVAK